MSEIFGKVVFFRTFGLLLLNLKLCHDCTSSLNFPSTLSLENHYVQSYHSKKVPLIHFFPSNISLLGKSLLTFSMFIYFYCFLVFYLSLKITLSIAQLCVSSALLTHLFPMHPFSTPWKHQETLRFSGVFRGQKKGALGTNGLSQF